jgi:hypothetical protein
MNLDILSLLIGGGLFGIGGILGIFTALFIRPAAPKREPDPYTCGCAHSLAHHDPDTNRCAASVEVQKYDRFNSRAGIERQPCACRQYVGERPVDPEALLDKFIRDHAVPLDPPAPQDRS